MLTGVKEVAAVPFDPITFIVIRFVRWDDYDVGICQDAGLARKIVNEGARLVANPKAAETRTNKP